MVKEPIREVVKKRRGSLQTVHICDKFAVTPITLVATAAMISQSVYSLEHRECNFAKHSLALWLSVMLRDLVHLM